MWRVCVWLCGRVVVSVVVLVCGCSTSLSIRYDDTRPHITRLLLVLPPLLVASDGVLLLLLLLSCDVALSRGWRCGWLAQRRSRTVGAWLCTRTTMRKRTEPTKYLYDELTSILCYCRPSSIVVCPHTVHTLKVQHACDVRTRFTDSHKQLHVETPPRRRRLCACVDKHRARVVVRSHVGTYSHDNHS